MSSVPAKVSARLSAALKRFQPIISSARARDVNESDTVVIATDLLSELFGYDKYHEITSEQVIRGTYCDLAIKVDGKDQFIIEVKAIGLDFKEGHIKQAVDYAANKGVDWVILTNAMLWRVYCVGFGKPITADVVMEIDLLSINPRSASSLEPLYFLSREGLQKSALTEYHVQRQATNRFVLGAVILSDPLIQVLRRELRRISPDVKIGIDELKAAVSQEVLKREVVEGVEAESARKRVQKAAGRALKAKRPAQPPKNAPTESPTPQAEAECEPEQDSTVEQAQDE